MGRRIPRVLVAPILAAVAAAWAPVPARAAVARDRVAVIEFKGQLSPAMSPAMLAIMTDQVRRAALEEAGARFEVMVKENMNVLLQQMGGDQKCSAAGCEVEVGRSIGAQVVITGEARAVGGSTVVLTKMFETGTGSLLAMEEFHADDELKLKEAALAAGTALLRKGFLKYTGAGAIPAAEAEEVAVRFESEPSGAMVTADGMLLCPATPCAKRLSVGLHEFQMTKQKHMPKTQKLPVARGSRIFMKLDPTYAVIKIETDPPGLVVVLDDKTLEGKSPIPEREVEPGTFKVAVRDRCYVEDAQPFRVKAGERRLILLTPKKRTGLVKVNAQDAEGNAVDGYIEVDGVQVGPTGKPIAVPVCAQTIRAVTDVGSWERRLGIRDNEVVTMDATVGTPSSIDRAVATPGAEGGAAVVTVGPGAAGAAAGASAAAAPQGAAQGTQEAYVGLSGVPLKVPGDAKPRDAGRDAARTPPSTTRTTVSLAPPAQAAPPEQRGEPEREAPAGRTSGFRTPAFAFEGGAEGYALNGGLLDGKTGATYSGHLGIYWFGLTGGMWAPGSSESIAGVDLFRNTGYYWYRPRGGFFGLLIPSLEARYFVKRDGKVLAAGAYATGIRFGYGPVGVTVRGPFVGVLRSSAAGDDRVGMLGYLVSFGLQTRL